MKYVSKIIKITQLHICVMYFRLQSFSRLLREVMNESTLENRQLSAKFRRFVSRGAVCLYSY